jgi:hypothetical protein
MQQILYVELQISRLSCSWTTDVTGCSTDVPHWAVSAISCLYAIVISWVTDVAEWSTGVQFKLQLKVNVQYVKRWASDVTRRATFTWHKMINRCWKMSSCYQHLISRYHIYVHTLSCRSNFEICQFYPFSATGFILWATRFTCCRIAVISWANCIAGNRTWLYRLPQSQKQCIYLVRRTAICMEHEEFLAVRRVWLDDPSWVPSWPSISSHVIR